MPASGKCTYAHARHRPERIGDDNVTRPSATRPRAGAGTASVTVAVQRPPARRPCDARCRASTGDRDAASIAPAASEREGHATAGERVAGGERLDLDAREVAERVQQRRRDESARAGT